MAGLKSFLNSIAPILGVSPLALYERQRALVNLGILKAVRGRGPGSGVPLTSYNVAAVVISVLATDNLSEVDRRVSAIIRAKPDLSDLPTRQLDNEWPGSYDFCHAVSAVLVGTPILDELKYVDAIRVTRCWRAQVVWGRGTPNLKIDYFLPDHIRRVVQPLPVRITAELESSEIERLSSFTLGALSQTASEGEDE
jgi:hypothetical protein